MLDRVRYADRSWWHHLNTEYERWGEQLTAMAFEADGVPVRVTWDGHEIAPRIPEVLPPEFSPLPDDVAAETFGLRADAPGVYTYTRDDSPVSSDLDLEFGLMMLQTQIRIFIGINAPDRIFVHAGAVALGGRALIFPGRSFSGKTSLVAEFLRAGATYLSDEFAVLDSDAMVHPYLTRLSVRGAGDDRRDVDATALGGTPATAGLPLGAVVVTSYKPGAEWAPTKMTRGRATLALLDNTVAALERHAEALIVFRDATAGSLLLSSDRGEAEPVVADLMSRLS